MSEKNALGRMCIITTRYRDLYYGTVTATDDEIVASESVRVVDCRHIAYWKGPMGGLTSLAAVGPSEGSRIGSPCSALITGVAHVLDCSPAAVRKFSEIEP